MTVAELKRRLCVGCKVIHLRSTPRGEINKVYTVVKAQTNAVCFLDPDGKEFWCYFPKAKDLIETADGFILMRGNHGESVYRWA